MTANPAASDLPPPRFRLAALLEHFATIDDLYDVRRILHPLREVLLLVVCGTIADCDDYDAIADWGAHVDFLRQHLPYTHGDPDEPHQPGPVLRSHDRAAGEPSLHLVSAFATTSRLVLGQEAVPDKSNELRAIPAADADHSDNHDDDSVSV